MRKRREKRSEEMRTDMKEAAVAEMQLAKGEALTGIPVAKTVETALSIPVRRHEPVPTAPYVPPVVCSVCGCTYGHTNYGTPTDSLGRLVYYYVCTYGCGRRFKIIKPSRKS